MSAKGRERRATQREMLQIGLGLVAPVQYPRHVQTLSPTRPDAMARWHDFLRKHCCVVVTGGGYVLQIPSWIAHMLAYANEVDDWRIQTEAYYTLLTKLKATITLAHRSADHRARLEACLRLGGAKALRNFIFHHTDEEIVAVPVEPT